MLGVYDCIFKATMLDIENREYLKEMIQCITKIPKEELKNIEIKNTEYTITNKKDKKNEK